MEQERTGFDLSLKKLTIDNFRGFGHLEMSFDKDTIVLIAENGGGKTTILDAIASGLKLFMWQLLREPFLEAPNFKTKDIKNGVVEPLNIHLDIIWSTTEYEEDLDGKAMTDKTKTEKFEYASIISLNKGQKDNECRIIENGFEYSAEKGSQFVFSDEFRKHYREGTRLPIVIYYGYNSINTFADSINDVKEDDIYHIYYDALEPNRFSFQSFHQWFDTQFKLSHIPDKKPNKALEIVCKAIEQMFNDDMSDKTYKDLRMRYSLYGNDMVIDKKHAEGKFDNNSWIEVSQMSAGEKMIFAMVADIAKRLILANPDLDNPLEGKGIVLIDEIDLHLHPKWQQIILYKLREIFPNIQIIATTHSPLVIQNFEGQILKIDEIKQLKPVPMMGGWSIEEILVKMGFSTRTELYGFHYIKLVNEFYSAYDAENIDLAQNIHDELIEYLPSEHPFRIVLKNKLESLKEDW